MTKEELCELIEEYGFRRDDVFKVEFMPDRVRFHVHQRNDDGKKFVWGTNADPAVKNGYGYNQTDLLTANLKIGEVATRFYDKEYDA